MSKTNKTNLNGQSVHAKEPKREPVWNDRRTAIVKAMRTLGAVGKTTARTAGEIAAKAKIKDVPTVKIVLDVYRTNELLHNGFADSVKHDGERELRYYLTAKGQKTQFPQKQKADDKPAKAKKAKKAPKAEEAATAAAE